MFPAVYRNDLWEPRVSDAAAGDEGSGALGQAVSVSFWVFRVYLFGHFEIFRGIIIISFFF